MSTIARLVVFLLGFWSLTASSGPILAFELVFVAASPAAYSKPHDLVLSPQGDRLYVADNDNDRIAILDPESLELLGEFGQGELAAPHDVIFDNKGQLLVADTRNHRIAIYELAGTEAKLLGEIRGSFRAPEGLALHPNGTLYITGAASGTIVAVVDGRETASAGGLSSPHDVAIAENGKLWVADSSNDRVLEMTPDLQIERIIEGEPYRFHGPRYLDFDAAGRLYVADKYANQVKVLDQNAKLILRIGKEAAGIGPGLFDRPEGVAIRGSDVWFSDTYNDRILRYRISE